MQGKKIGSDVTLSFTLPAQFSRVVSAFYLPPCCSTIWIKIKKIHSCVTACTPSYNDSIREYSTYLSCSGNQTTNKANSAVKRECTRQEGQENLLLLIQSDTEQGKRKATPRLAACTRITNQCPLGNKEALPYLFSFPCSFPAGFNPEGVSYAVVLPVPRNKQLPVLLKFKFLKT